MEDALIPVIGATSLDIIQKEYLDIENKLRPKKIEHAQIYDAIMEHCGEKTFEEQLMVIDYVEMLSQSTLERVRDSQAKGKRIVPTIFWLCVIFDAPLELSIAMFYSYRHRFDFFESADMVMLQILYYLPVYGGDESKRCKRVKALLKKYKIDIS